MKKILTFLTICAILFLLPYCGYRPFMGPEPDPAHSVGIPDFPWPPPRPSAFVEIPKKFFSNSITLFDVNRILTEALDKCDYTERSYYSVPHGYAIVTRIEQINSDATSKTVPARWSIKPEIYTEFNLASYIRAVFFSNPGLFRIFTIIISDKPFRASGEPITKDEGMNLLNEGLNTLPSELGNILKSKETFCTVLVYEFEKSEVQDTSYVVLPGRHSGGIHLQKSMIQYQIEMSHENRYGSH